jgi:chromosome segregation ATPase
MNISEAHLEFSEGINIIQGLVGSGKSAVFAAIAYALSDYRRGDTWKEYVKTGEAFFEITITYAFGNDKNSSMVLYIKGDPKRASTSKELSYQGRDYKNSEVDSFLLSKFDLDIMSKVIFNLQGKQPLALMTPAERRDIFKKIFNSDFNEILEKIKANKEELQKYIPTRKAEIEVLKNKEYPLFRIIAVDESELMELQEELKKSQLSQTMYLLLSQYTEKLNQLNKANKDVERVHSTLELYKANLGTKHLRIKEIEATLVAQNKSLHDQTLCLTSLTSSLKDAEVKYEIYKESIVIDTLKETKRKLEDELVQVKADIAINTRYLETHKKGKCESCGQECLVSKIEKFEKIIQDLQGQKEDRETSIATYNKTITDYETTCKEWEKKIQITLLNDITKQKIIITEIQNKLDTLNNNVKELKDTIIPDNEKIVINTEKELESFTITVNQIQEWIKNNPKPEVKEEYRDATTIQNTISEIQGRIQGNINKAELNEKLKLTRIQDEATIVALNLELNNLESKVNILSTVNQIYSIDFPSFINMKACSLLESHMNNFFATTKDSFEVALQADKKGIAFYYKSNNELQWRNLKMVSGFESALSTLGFNVSVARAFGSDLIFLDEPEANADPQTAERLFETIASIGGFNQMFVITHKENVLPILKEQGAKIYKVKGGVFTDMIDY